MVSVDHVMSRSVVTVTLDDTLRTIRNLFERHGFHHVIVTDEGRAVGVVSDRDLLRHLSPYLGTFGERQSDTKTLEKKAHQVMSRSIIAIDSGSSLADAAAVMLDSKVSCLPVLVDGRCEGIVTWRTILRWAVENGVFGDQREAA